MLLQQERGGIRVGADLAEEGVELFRGGEDQRLAIVHLRRRILALDDHRVAHLPGGHAPVRDVGEIAPRRRRHAERGGEAVHLALVEAARHGGERRIGPHRERREALRLGQQAAQLRFAHHEDEVGPLAPQPVLHLVAKALGAGAFVDPHIPQVARARGGAVRVVGAEDDAASRARERAHDGDRLPVVAED
jgi:hypothetical protein